MTSGEWLHVLAVVIAALAVFAAFHNICFALNGQPKTLRRYLAVNGLFAVALAIVYGGDLFGLWDPAEPHTVGRSMVMALTFMLCTDVLLRRGSSSTCDRIARVLMAPFRRDKEGPHDAA